jgi:hypothetical protein
MSLFEFPIIFLGGSLLEFVETVIFFISLVAGVCPCTIRRNNPGEVQEPVRGVAHVRQVRTQVQIRAFLGRQNGRLINSQRPLITSFLGETRSLRFREWDESI